MNEYSFSEDEWKACLKVLSSLVEDPLNNPDNLAFKTLITQISKKAKKQIALQKDMEPIAKRDNQFMSRRERQKKEDADLLRQTTIVDKANSNSTVFQHAEDEHKPTSKLHSPLRCYICNSYYTELHFFYHRLCPDCAAENYNKRKVQVNLSGYKAIVTGARVKVGYATTLKLLRIGASVIATSRFPALALESYKTEPDFETWKDQLILYGLDLRNIKEVYAFTTFCKNQFEAIDILINNAAQTIKYNQAYYLPLQQNEALALTSGASFNLIENKTPIFINQQKLLATNNGHFFPTNRFGQPIDLRTKNSWNSTLTEVDLEELLEVNLINHISPYLLISELKENFIKSKNSKRFIINVTSSEGQFSYNNKTIHHPHTNMTKAALNMLTRTSAAEFVEDNIFMNSVDVGWISTGAFEKKRKRLFEDNKVPPLDCVDGATRILMCIADILENRNEYYGKLLKNYKPVDW